MADPVSAYSVGIAVINVLRKVIDSQWTQV